jgi:hypothetical protein
MKTPFTREQFFAVFESYNSKVFPFQLLILLLGIVMLSLLHSRHSFKNKVIGMYLGALWIWSGLFYHILFFTEINEAAFIFGGAFVIQGVLILVSTFFKDHLNFDFKPQATNYLGYFFVLFGLIIYPLIGYFSQRSLLMTITLGLPCPSTIFTFGFLMLIRDRVPKYLLIIPSLWAIVGVTAAINFGVYQDFMMIIAAISANGVLIKRKTKASSTLQSSETTRANIPN